MPRGMASLTYGNDTHTDGDPPRQRRGGERKNLLVTELGLIIEASGLTMHAPRRRFSAISTSLPEATGPCGQTSPRCIRIWARFVHRAWYR